MGHYYKLEINDEGRAQLNALVHQRIYEIVSFHLEVDSHSVEATVYSFSHDDKWINVLSEQRQTPNYVNYYQICIKVTADPIRVSRDADNHLTNCSRVRIDRGIKPIINRILVYKSMEEFEGEVVEYDSHLLLELDSGSRVCIGVLDTVAELLELSTHEQYIDSMLEDVTPNWILS